MSIYQTLSKIPFLKRPLYNLLYSHIANNQRRINHEILSKTASLKNRHLNDSCFIIGTGPSLKIDDLKAIEATGSITFAPNRIYEICESSGWKPTYYICQDHKIISEFADRIADIDSELSFFPVEYINRFQGDKFRFFVLKEREFYPSDAKFSFDIAKCINQGYTVTYAAIQLAIFMGFKKIYLIGIDHNYSVFRDSNGRPIRRHTTESDYSEGMTQYQNHQNLPRIEESTIAYETAEKMSHKAGVKIFNATRGGKLEAFERVDLDELIENLSKH